MRRRNRWIRCSRNLLSRVPLLLPALQRRFRICLHWSDPWEDLSLRISQLPFCRSQAWEVLPSVRIAPAPRLRRPQPPRLRRPPRIAVIERQANRRGSMPLLTRGNARRSHRHLLLPTLLQSSWCLLLRLDPPAAQPPSVDMFHRTQRMKRPKTRTCKPPQRSLQVWPTLHVQLRPPMVVRDQGRVCSLARHVHRLLHWTVMMMSTSGNRRHMTERQSQRKRRTIQIQMWKCADPSTPAGPDARRKSTRTSHKARGDHSTPPLTRLALPRSHTSSIRSWIDQCWRCLNKRSMNTNRSTSSVKKVRTKPAKA